MTMDGRVALVAGGAGTVGSGIVHAFLNAGATVIVPSRERARLDALRGELASAGLPAGASERLIVIEADIAMPAGAAEIRALVERDVIGRGGQLDHLVTSLGGTWRGGALREIDLDAFHAALHEYAGSHFVAMRALLPLMEDRAGASYTIISGVAGEQLFDLAWGPVSVGAATLFGLSMVTRAEYAEKPLRVNELRVGMRVARKHPVQGSPFEVSHRDVGKLVVGMAESQVRSEVIRVGDQTEFRASCGRFGVL
jgi:3-oxoacyl-[acyl-carrier protein] reductase